MATIATTSHKKEIHVKINLFSLSKQFKSLLSLHLTFFAWKINNYWEIQIFNRHLAASRAVRSIELDI